MKEDYVSFEIAKLLKEKGFVGESEIGDRCGFYKQNKEYPNQINLVYDGLDNSELEWNECLRFTHQMAMKWLREVHNIIITIHPNSFDADGVYYKADIWFNREYVSSYDIEEREKKVYEESVEDSLKYCLTNLI